MIRPLRARESRTRSQAPIGPPPLHNRPQCSKARRQPTSKQGVKWALNRATANPAKPIKGATPGTSIAHKPKSCSLKRFWMPSTIASVSTRLRGLRQNSITRVSEFIAANAPRSSSRHRRRQMRPPDNVTKELIAARSYGRKHATARPSRVKRSGSGLARRPSGVPSIADILMRCREPPLWATIGGGPQRCLSTGRVLLESTVKGHWSEAVDLCRHIESLTP
jgi:hypothetical protein